MFFVFFEFFVFLAGLPPGPPSSPQVFCGLTLPAGEAYPKTRKRQKTQKKKHKKTQLGIAKTICFIVNIACWRPKKQWFSRLWTKKHKLESKKLYVFQRFCNSNLCFFDKNLENHCVSLVFSRIWVSKINFLSQNKYFLQLQFMFFVFFFTIFEFFLFFWQALPPDLPDPPRSLTVSSKNCGAERLSKAVHVPCSLWLLGIQCTVTNIW